MSQSNNFQEVTGPQGTQVFERDQVKQMIAAELSQPQSESATQAALVGLSDSVSGQQILLSQSKLSVGRSPSSDILLDDASVSSMHAQVFSSSDGWKVLNLLSSNGTYVNGNKVSESLLVAGDRLAFGNSEFVLTFVESDNLAPAKSNLFGLGLVALGLLAAMLGLFYIIA